MYQDFLMQKVFLAKNKIKICKLYCTSKNASTFFKHSVLLHLEKYTISHKSADNQNDFYKIISHSGKKNTMKYYHCPPRVK